MKGRKIEFSEVKTGMEIAFVDHDGNMLTGKVRQVYSSEDNNIIGCEVITKNHLAWDLSKEEGDNIFTTFDDVTSNKTAVNDGFTSEVVFNPTYIINAGKNIKNIVYVTLAMIFILVMVFLHLLSLDNIESIRTLYYFIGVVSLVCNIIILGLLYSIGNDLEKSVSRK